MVSEGNGKDYWLTSSLRSTLFLRLQVAKAEDFYTSMGFPEMTNKFWKNSRFESHGNKSACHGTAADMFTGDDFRYGFLTSFTSGMTKSKRLF